MNHISDWTERIRRLQGWLADPLDLISALGDTATSCRQASKEGFARLRANCGMDYEWETWSTEWWLSQALKKFRGESEVAASDRATQAISGFLARNDEARSIRLPRLLRARVRELLERALPPPAEMPSGHFGPGAVAERVDSVIRWGSLGMFRLNPRTGAWEGSRDAAWHKAPSCVARLCAVPKDVLRDRLITVEPCENSFWQQALRDALLLSVHSGPLRGTVMDQIVGGVPEVQQRTRCRIGSLRGHTTTLDLEDASDGISYQTVADTFPAWVMYWVDLCRTTEFTYPGCVGGSRPLYMYGGMGNASTFMVETLYFWAVFTAICERLRAFSLVTAFGDDIIVPSSGAMHPCFPDYCREAGLKLNLTKSVLDPGPGFREACGCACIRGLELAELISIKGPFDNTDVGRVNLAGLITRLDHSPLFAHRLLARDLYDSCDLACVQWDRPLDGLDVILSKDLPPRGNVTMTWDKSYQRWFIRSKTARPVSHRYYFKDLGLNCSLGVLRGQLHTETVKRRGAVRTRISVDVPHRTRIVRGKVYLPW